MYAWIIMYFYCMAGDYQGLSFQLTAHKIHIVVMYSFTSLLLCAYLWLWGHVHVKFSSYLIAAHQRPNFESQSMFKKSSRHKPLQMNISCFLGVWFPIWLRPDNGDIAVTHSFRSPASISSNQISLLGLFIIPGSDCEWCLANGFSIQICWLDAAESQQGLSFPWLRQPLQSGANKRKITWWNLHLCRVFLNYLLDLYWF